MRPMTTHSQLGTGTLALGRVFVVHEAGSWKTPGHASGCEKDGAAVSSTVAAAWRWRREIKCLACLCICLVLWIYALTEALGRCARSMQRQMAPTPDRMLRFTKNGTFQISVFEDLHFAENSDKDVLSQRVMKSVLSTESPQLVVINGDLVSGEQTSSSNSYTYLHQVVSPLVDRGLLWASTYGNHDSNPNLDPWQDIFVQEKQYTNSLTQSMVSHPDAGVTNYYLPVYSSETEVPALILWFFDSKGGRVPSNRISKRDTNRPDWVDQSVVDWFNETNSDLRDKYGRVVPSLAFYHIPADAMRAYQDDGVNPHTAPGINGETVVQQGSGDTSYTGQDTEFMRALLNTAGLMATFSGHDHDNDWCFKWDGNTTAQNLSGNGLNMCYGRHTGYGGYGDASRGGRQIVLNEKTVQDEVETWILLEDGTISAHVTLNATYGQDRYSPGIKRAAGVLDSAAPHLNSPEPLLFMTYLWFPIFMLFYLKH